MKPSKKSLTVKDIAKIAGVSPMTVSRALNNYPYVKTETKERVLSIAKKYNFFPNPLARMFSTKKSNIIGLIVADIANPFYSELAKAIEDRAYELGFSVIVSCSKDESDIKHKYINQMLKSGVDGLVISSVKLQDPLVTNLIRQNFPIVLVNRKLKDSDCNYVVLDNFIGAYNMTKHLINNGFKNIALIGGLSNTWTGRERLKGYKQALRDHKIRIRQENIYQGVFSYKIGYQGTKKLLELRQKPQAIFAESDQIAMGVFDALSECNLKVPKDIALVSFDDTSFSRNSRVRLTTVSQKESEMGKIATDILIGMIISGQDNVHKVILKPELIIRDSCGYGLKRHHSEQS